MAGFRDRSGDVVDLSAVSHPAVTVIVDLGTGEPLVVEDGTGLRRSGSVVAGLAAGGLRGGGRDVECLQIRLSPVVARAVLGAPAGELGGSLVALDDLWGPDAARIQDRLRSAASWDDRFAIAEAALARRLSSGQVDPAAPGAAVGSAAVDPEIGFAWDEMVASRGQLRVDGLAAELGWSRKRLWSRFRSQIGLTPKRAAQLVRFDHAAHRLASGHAPAEVAAEAGYTDQSHLHRATLAFAGLTPTALAAAPWLAVDPTAWPTLLPSPSPSPRPR
jgi:AraC-like DNA-binding protein